MPPFYLEIGILYSRINNMEFAYDKWDKNTFKKLEDYLLSISHLERVRIEQNIIRTNSTMLSIHLPELKEIAKSIFKGNYISFLECNTMKYYEEQILQAFVINKIKDAKIQRKYIDSYLNIADSWAHTDALKIYVNQGNMEEWWDYINELIISPKTFYRRAAFIFMFKFINTPYLEDIFKLLNTLNKEEEYYVNMAAAWLVCECFIKRRSETLSFMQNNNLNGFTQNKAISKCRDSFRVSKEDKELLLSYKK